MFIWLDLPLPRYCITKVELAFIVTKCPYKDYKLVPQFEVVG